MTEYTTETTCFKCGGDHAFYTGNTYPHENSKEYLDCADCAKRYVKEWSFAGDLKPEDVEEIRESLEE